MGARRGAMSNETAVVAGAIDDSASAEVGEELPWYVSKALFASLLACVFALLSVVIASLHIKHHLRHYHEPVVQRYTVRILLMVPIYAVMSCITLFTFRTLPNLAFVVTLLRDIYEAYTLYNFLSLLLCLLGGPNVLVSKWKDDMHHHPATSPGGAVEDGQEEEDDLSSQFTWWTLTCCLKDWLKIDINNPLFLRTIRQGVMQYIFVKIVLAIIQIVLKFTKLYGDGELDLTRGYIYVMVVYNISIFIALYALVVFYLATKKYLKPYRPVAKFALVKIIIFVTFWQQLIVTVLFKLDVIKPLNGMDSGESGSFLVNFLICVEAVPLAGLNILGFPPGTVKKGKETNVWHSLKHFVRMSDVLMDTAHTFAPGQKYQEFVVINAQEGFHQEEDLASPSPDTEGGGGGYGAEVVTQPPLIALDAEMSHEQVSERNAKAPKMPQP